MLSFPLRVELSDTLREGTIVCSFHIYKTALSFANTRPKAPESLVQARSSLAARNVDDDGDEDVHEKGRDNDEEESCVTVVPSLGNRHVVSGATLDEPDAR